MKIDEQNTVILKVDDKAVKKARIQGLIVGAVAGSLAVACIKDDSDTVKELGKVITTVATSYYGCKFIYELLY